MKRRCKYFPPKEPDGAHLMLCQDCRKIRPFDRDGHDEKYHCDCGGAFCGCPSCDAIAEEILRYLEEREEEEFMDLISKL